MYGPDQREIFYVGPLPESEGGNALAKLEERHA
jgi:hypothetical protein